MPFLKPPISGGSARRVGPTRRSCCMAGASQERGQTGRRATGTNNAETVISVSTRLLWLLGVAVSWFRENGYMK